MAGKVYVGVGGWVFEPWRGSFYPEGLPRKRELEYASRQVTSIEINGTFYGAQKPTSFAKWRDETPDGFVFSLKGPRFATHRRVLAEAGDSVARFVEGGLSELKDKLGPINWQLPPTKRFEPEDFEAFLGLLPAEVDGLRLRHAVEVRHDSFRTPAFVEMLRARGVGAVLGEKAGLPLIADVTAPFVYARLQSAAEDEEAGYPAAALDAWARRAAAWSTGGAPDDLPILAAPETRPPKARDVFLYVINGFKPKAPAAARALIARL